MSVISIEQDEEYNALIEKLESFISIVEKKSDGNKRILDRQLFQAEYSLQKLFRNGKFNKEKYLTTKLQVL